MPLTLASLIDTLIGVVKGTWSSIVQLWRPTPGTVAGQATKTDISYSQVSAILLGVASFILAHIAELTGILSSMGLSPSMISIITYALTFYVQVVRKADDGTVPAPAPAPQPAHFNGLVSQIATVDLLSPSTLQVEESGIIE